jgi:hypothetical protein
MSDQKKSAVEMQSRGSQELSDQELDGVSGGMLVSGRFNYQWGNTLYDVTVSVGGEWPYVSASARGIASR